MIVDDKSKTFKLKCDYCGREFNRIKYDVLKSRKVIEKDSCGIKKCKAAKIAESNIKKYGVANVYQIEEVRKKQQKTLLENYGVLVPAKSKVVLEKIRNTNLKKYGNSCSLHGKEVAEKTKRTWMARYGCEHPFASKEVMEKSRSTMEKRYGSHFTKTEEYREKTKETCMKKYGKEHHLSCESVKQKRKNTNLEKYGCEYASQNDDVMRKILNSKKGKLTKYGKTQNEIKEFLQEISGEVFHSKHIKRLELDIFSEKMNMAVEYCGLHWHTEVSPCPRDSKYHAEKYIMCKSLGVRLITIFEDEWLSRKSQCKGYLNSILGKSLKYNGRSCYVKKIDNRHSNMFYESHHIQGKPYGTKVSFGVFDKDELLGCVSLGNHHRMKNKIVLNRLCFKGGVRVTGGAGKLFSACEKWCSENGFDQITTWSDNRWSDGGVYAKLGFVMEKELPPDYSYVDTKKRGKRVSKQSMKKSNTGCPDNITEKNWAERNGFARIWDCGKKRWSITIDVKGK